MFDVEFYNRKYDWLVASLLAVPLVLVFYGGDAAIVSALGFALVGALKPLTRWLGNPLAAGVFAAGVVLALSPLLRFIFYNGFCYGGAWSPAAGISHYQSPDLCQRGMFASLAQGIWIGPLRDVAMPTAGLGLMWLSLPKSLRGEAEQEYQDVIALSLASKMRRAARWGGLVLALVFWIAGTGYNYREVQVALEEQRAAELAQERQDAFIAAEVAKRKAAEEAAQAAQAAAEDAAKRVGAGWLIGGWAAVQGYGGKPDPERYCATDAGYIFKKGSKYVGGSHEGTFAVKDNVLTLSNRISFEIGDPDYQSERLPPLKLKVERKGDKLIIEGELYGRC